MYFCTKKSIVQIRMTKPIVCPVNVHLINSNAAMENVFHEFGYDNNKIPPKSGCLYSKKKNNCKIIFCWVAKRYVMAILIVQRTMMNRVVVLETVPKMSLGK